MSDVDEPTDISSAVVANEVPPPAPEPSWWPNLPTWTKVAVPSGVVVFVAVVVAVVVNSQPSQFETAIAACGLQGNSFVRAGDGGSSLILDMEGDEENGLRIDDFACMLLELEASDVVVEQMSSTRALDGRQAGEWNGIDATWSYHPDSGLDVILVQK